MAAMQTPTVGRVVHVAVSPDINNGQDYAAATITRVWEGTDLINVSAILDSPSGPVQMTSVKLHEDRPENAHYAAWWPPRTQ